MKLVTLFASLLFSTFSFASDEIYDESRHNDMTDYGPKWLKDEISKIIDNFLDGTGCRVNS